MPGPSFKLVGWGSAGSVALGPIIGAGGTTFTPSTSSNAASSTATSSTPNPGATQVVLSGFPSVALTAATLNTTIEGQFFQSGGTGTISFKLEVSKDGGTTWSTLQTWSAAFSQQTLSYALTSLTNLSLVQIRLTAQAALTSGNAVSGTLLVSNWNANASLSGAGVTFPLYVFNQGTTTLTIPNVTVTPTSGTPSGDITFTSLATIIPAGQLVKIGTLAIVPSLGTGQQEEFTMVFSSNAVSGVRKFDVTFISASPTDTLAYLWGYYQDSLSVVYHAPVVEFSPGSNVAQMSLNNPTGSNLNVVISSDVTNGFESLFPNSFALTPAQTVEPLDPSLVPGTTKVTTYDPEAFTVAGSGTTTLTYDQATAGQYVITTTFMSAFNLTDATEAVWFAFWNTVPTPTLTQANPNDLNCEEAGSFSQQLDFELPDKVKSLERFLIRYERLGACTLAVTYAAASPMNQSAVTTSRTTDAAADNLIRSAIFDGAIAGEVVQITFNRAALAGPLSITTLCPYFEERGEIVENT